MTCHFESLGPKFSPRQEREITDIII